MPGGLPSVVFRALGKDAFAECFFDTRQRGSLPSVFLTLGNLCRVSKKKHSAKSLFAECKKNTRQRRLCRVPEKQHSANHLALGKEPVSGSDIANVANKCSRNRPGMYPLTRLVLNLKLHYQRLYADRLYLNFSQEQR